jgi:hypothetical protein
MKQIRKILNYCLIISFAILLMGTGCATARQNPWQKKRSKASHVNTSQLGRNKYYFSVGYQKKLVKSMKKKK